MRWLRILFSLVIVGVLSVGPYLYILYRKDTLRNFHVVSDGVLYRSGQPSLTGLKRLIFERGIKTVVTLRYADNEEDPHPDQEEEQFCRREGYNYFRIPFRPWWASDGSIPAEKGVDQFLQIMDNPANYPVLVHCFAGIHRTGTYCAIYRMEFEKWSSQQAIREMRHFGYADDHSDVLHYLENYQRKGLAPPPGRLLSSSPILPASQQVQTPD